MISNPSLPREKPVLSHWATGKVFHSLTHSDWLSLTVSLTLTLTQPQVRSYTHSLPLTQSDSPDDIVHYGLTRKHKNYSYCVNQNHGIIWSCELRNLTAERFPDFEIQEIQELKENSEHQNTKEYLRKVHRPGSMSGPTGPKTRTLKPILVLAYEAKINWTSQFVV